MPAVSGPGGTEGEGAPGRSGARLSLRWGLEAGVGGGASGEEEVSYAAWTKLGRRPGAWLPEPRFPPPKQRIINHADPEGDWGSDGHTY